MKSNPVNESPVALGHPLPDFDYKSLYEQMTKISNNNYADLCDALTLLRQAVENGIDWSCRANIIDFLERVEDGDGDS